MNKKRKIRWAVALAGAAVLTISIGLATALASPSSGTITPVIIATGSMPTGMGLAVHPGTNTIVGPSTRSAPTHRPAGTATPARRSWWCSRERSPSTTTTATR